MPACMLPCMLQGWLHEPAREEPRTRLVGVGPHARVLDAPRRAAGVLGEARQEGAGEEVPAGRSEEHTSELQSRGHLVCRLLLEKKKVGCKSTPAVKKDDQLRPASRFTP